MRDIQVNKIESTETIIDAKHRQLLQRAEQHKAEQIKRHKKLFNEFPHLFDGIHG